MLAWLRCLVRQQHRPVRHILGGYKCVDCGAAGASLDELGQSGGYVDPERRTYRRGR
jgi:hypothetical protein